MSIVQGVARASEKPKCYHCHWLKIIAPLRIPNQCKVSTTTQVNPSIITFLLLSIESSIRNIIITCRYYISPRLGVHNFTPNKVLWFNSRNSPLLTLALQCKWSTGNTVLQDRGKRQEIWCLMVTNKNFTSFLIITAIIITNNTRY